MIKWLHHLFNPHCPDCLSEKMEQSYCNSCDVMKMEVERLRQENTRLLNIIIEPKVESRPEIDLNDLKPLQPRYIPLSVRRERFEAEDRRIAQRLKEEAPVPDKVKELAELNKELEDVRQ